MRRRSVIGCAGGVHVGMCVGGGFERLFSHPYLGPHIDYVP